MSIDAHDEEELCQRAANHYFQTGGTEQPVGGAVVTHNTARYVVLRKAHGVLAVYQLMASGSLQRLKGWPRAVEAT